MRIRAGPRALVLLLLLLLGALHWALFLDSSQPGFGPSAVQDWPKEFRYYAVLRQAVTESRVPYFLSAPIVFSRKFLAIPEVTWSPQVALLGFLPIPLFIVVNTLLAYAAGVCGLLLLERRYRLGLLPFALLFALFSFNGHVTAHLAIGHSMWLGYFLLPFFVLGVLAVLERPETPLLAEKLSLVVRHSPAGFLPHLRLVRAVPAAAARLQPRALEAAAPRALLDGRPRLLPDPARCLRGPSERAGLPHRLSHAG